MAVFVSHKQNKHEPSYFIAKNKPHLTRPLISSSHLFSRRKTKGFSLFPTSVYTSAPGHLLFQFQSLTDFCYLRKNTQFQFVLYILTCMFVLVTQQISDPSTKQNTPHKCEFIFINKPSLWLIFTSYSSQAKFSKRGSSFHTYISQT